LTELAEVVTRDVFYLAHIFEWEVGLPPHAYLDSVRIRKSKLLASGLSIASVAFVVGYADQAISLIASSAA
jgi:AraC-like DNA-binding protein